MTLIVVKLLERTFSWIIFLAPSLQKFSVTNVPSLTAYPSPSSLGLTSQYTRNGDDWTLLLYYHYSLEKVKTRMLWWEMFSVVQDYSHSFLLQAQNKVSHLKPIENLSASICSIWWVLKENSKHWQKHSERAESTISCWSLIFSLRS